MIIPHQAGRKRGEQPRAHRAGPNGPVGLCHRESQRREEGFLLCSAQARRPPRAVRHSPGVSPAALTCPPPTLRHPLPLASPLTARKAANSGARKTPVRMSQNWLCSVPAEAGGMSGEGLQKFLKQVPLGTSECPLVAWVQNHRKPQENAPWSPGLLSAVGEGHAAGHQRGAVSAGRTKRLRELKKERKKRERGPTESLERG